MKLKHITEAARYQQIPGQNCHLCMAPFDITVEGVRKLLSNLNPYKAVGADIIHPRVLEELSAVIAPALCNIFRASLQFVVVPSDYLETSIHNTHLQKGAQAIAGKLQTGVTST